MVGKTPLIIITGPTCSGKTSLAMHLRKDYPIEVLSADSMQVYRYLDIGTAKPSPDERTYLKHYLIDMVNPDQEFNAGMFTHAATKALIDIKSTSHIPLVVGGTGLYIRALVYGLSDAPAASCSIRTAINKVARRKGRQHLYKMLKRLDPEYASKITFNDISKIMRALEIIFLTGRRPSDIHSDHAISRPVLPALVACINPDKETLYSNINKRVISMIDRGLVQETERLLDMGYSPELPSLKNFTYRHVISYLSSEIYLDRMIQLIQRDTRRFAKRQLTWFRANKPECVFLDLKDATSTVNQWLKEYWHRV